MTWQNRIVGHDNVPPDQLLAHPENWRVHPKYQQEALRGVINDIGYIKSVTVNQRTGRVVDGHLRVTLALRDGVPTIPVEYVDLTDAEEAEALLTLDPIAALAGSDKDNLEALLAQVNTDDAAVMELLENIAHDGGIIPSLEDLERKYGESSEEDFWFTVNIKIPPETEKKYKELMKQMDGDTEAEKFYALISCVVIS